MVDRNWIQRILDKLKWKIFPGRCVLCGKWKLWWKLWGINPHRACEDYELGQDPIHDCQEYLGEGEEE